MSERFEVKYWHCFCLTIVAIIISAIVGGFVYAMAGVDTDLRDIAALGLSHLLSTGIVILFGMRLFFLPAGDVFAVSRPRVSILAPVIIAVLGLVAVEGFVTEALIYAIPSINTLGETLNELYNPQYTVPSLLLLGIVAPLTEETLFRGLMLGALLRSGYRPWGAIMVSSLLFAFSHMNAVQFVVALCVGMYCGYVYERTGNLLYSMLVHGLFNSIPVLLIAADIKLPFVSMNGMHLDMPGIITVGTGVVLLVIGLALGVRVLKPVRRTPAQTESETSFD